MTIPSKGITAEADDFEHYLTEMYDRGENDGDIKFARI